MAVSRILAGALKRDRAIVALGLAGIVTLSWTYLIWMDWGMRHMDIGMEMVIMACYAELDRLASSSRVSDVGGHDGRNDGPDRQSGDFAFYRDQSAAR